MYAMKIENLQDVEPTKEQIKAANEKGEKLVAKK